VFTREDPPGGGPVPALRAGLREVTAPRVVLLAGDLPFLEPAHVITLLESAAPHEGGGAVAVDAEGREQWLLGVWDVPTLRAALDGYQGRSLHGLLAPLVAARVALAGRAWFDCDTMDDLNEARVTDTTRTADPGRGRPRGGRPDPCRPYGEGRSGRVPDPWTGGGGPGREDPDAEIAMNVLNEWTALACKELGVDPARVDRDRILDLTKDVAHGVARPAAPLTAYLLGLAEGSGTAPADAVARLTALAENWGEATAQTLTGD
jgi:hypothetical protein